jgi:hypothetical protein
VIEARFANETYIGRNHHQPGQGSMAIFPPCDPAQYSHNGATHMTANWKETLALGFVVLALMVPLTTCTVLVETARYEAQAKP